METVYKRSTALTERQFSYCPGCTHGVAHRLIAELLEEMDLIGETIAVGCVGCAAPARFFFNVDFCRSMHGRGPAEATGVKRMNPDKLVFTYQGDGDFISIGTAETVHAANRGEKITSIFINNTTFGMTGGQMAPTTLVGQYSTTSQDGRKEELVGKPIRAVEMLATLEGCKFAERVSLDSPGAVRNAKRAIKRAFECQLKGLGYSVVEILSTCPSNWHMDPVKCTEFIRTDMIPYFPVGNFKDFED